MKNIDHRLLYAIALFALLPIQFVWGAWFGLAGHQWVDVAGLGWFDNLNLVRSLSILDTDAEAGESLEVTYIEDVAWLINEEVTALGYLKPRLQVTLLHRGETVWEASWKQEFAPALPDDLRADKMKVEVIPGNLYYFDTIKLNGMPIEFKATDPASFFYATDGLLFSRRDRYYTSGRLRAGIRNVMQHLRDSGYRDVKLISERTHMNRETGAVDVELEFEHGLQYFVRKVILHSDIEVKEKVFTNQIMTQTWIMSYVQNVKKSYQSRGYPEVELSITHNERHEESKRMMVDLSIAVESGDFARLAQVHFEGDPKTHPALLRRQANLKIGEPLDLKRTEDGRDALARLNSYRSIQMRYDNQQTGDWDVIYELTPKPNNEISVIAGVGSYDIVRGGVELEQNNLWGYAHSTRLKAIQSFKSTTVDYVYSIPQIFGYEVDLFSDVNYLNREEITFTRQEYGFSAGVQRYFTRYNLTSSLQYNYELLDARESNFINTPAIKRAFASSIEMRLNHNEVDNALYPENGYQLAGSIEVALPQIGGSVEYQKLELSGVYHKPLSSDTFLHLGLKNGLINSFSVSEENIPINKRFFLGGENTVRGYRRGQASPFSTQGEQIGAATFILGQAELQQRLTRSVSLTLFVDTVGLGTHIKETPFSEFLSSGGGGVSVRTPVGPLRFEYGHNLNPRKTDPKGTFQIAIGAPF